MNGSPLPNPPADPQGAVDWVERHLVGLFSGEVGRSGPFRGGQGAADAALAGFDVAGYAGTRNEVWPTERRGASALSPYIRHGLLTLPRVWEAVDDGPARDVRKFRDELLWQEYSRHLYARMGSSTKGPLRYRMLGHRSGERPWPSKMACVDLAMGELERDGWMVNQTRMWMASQWSVRHAADWQQGEEYFFQHLLDGSRAANRLGWQWTVGLLTGKQYGFSRWQVQKRAPGVCDGCDLSEDCPIQDWPDDTQLNRLEADRRLRSDPDLGATAGPSEVESLGEADSVWLTAESMGDDDPALSANGDLPVIFVFDRTLLERLQLSAKRLVFLAENLADLAQRRRLTTWLGDPAEVLAGHQVATTFAPVPGWKRHRRKIDVVQTHPWPWLRNPHAGSVASFSAWRKQVARG